MNVQGVEIWSGIVRSILHFFDGIIFFLLKPVLQGVFDLSSLTISSNLLNGVYTRIYVIVGIFMAFKLGFNFFKYIIDPDSLTDGKDKSLGKLLTNTVIMLAALIMLPIILFSTDGRESLVSRAERAFLPMLPRIILGTDVNTTPESLSKAGDAMATTVMSAFFAPSENLSEYCNIDSKKYPEIKSLDDVGKYLHSKCPAKNSSGGYSEYYIYTYNGVASTIVGGLLVVMFLGITINVAKRIFKLIILEVLAPIPIMTLIDTKSASSGMFSKWMSSFISVFFDLFIQYGIVYIGIYFIQLIVNKGLFSNMSSITGFRGAYIVVALIIGVIYFAKEAPKFIQDALGLKGTGSMGSIFGNAMGVLGLGTMAAGSIRGGVNRLRASFENDARNGRPHSPLNLAKNVGAGLFGMASGATTGAGVWAWNSFRGKGNDPSSLWKRQKDFTNRGIEKMTGKSNKLKSALEAYMKEAGATAKKDAADKSVTGHDINDNAITITHYDEWISAFEAAKASGKETFSVNTTNGVRTFKTYSQEAAKLDKELNGDAVKQLVTDASKDGKGAKDPMLNALWNNVLNNGGKTLVNKNTISRDSTKSISDYIKGIDIAETSAKFKAKKNG